MPFLWIPLVWRNVTVDLRRLYYFNPGSIPSNCSAFLPAPDIYVSIALCIILCLTCGITEVSAIAAYQRRVVLRGSNLTQYISHGQLLMWCDYLMMRCFPTILKRLFEIRTRTFLHAVFVQPAPITACFTALI